MAETGIQDELSEKGVTSVKRVRIEDQGQEKDTNTLFLTFCNSSLPKDIHIGHLRVKVDPFVPNPLRCFKCQKYGHGAQGCSSAAVCPKCALEHEGTCTPPPPPTIPTCVNCDGAHPSSSKECHVWNERVKQGQNCPILMHANMYGRPDLGCCLAQNLCLSRLRPS